MRSLKRLCGDLHVVNYAPKRVVTISTEPDLPVETKTGCDFACSNTRRAELMLIPTLEVNIFC